MHESLFISKPNKIKLTHASNTTFFLLLLSCGSWAHIFNDSFVGAQDNITRKRRKRSCIKDLKEDRSIHQIIFFYILLPMLRFLLLDFFISGLFSSMVFILSVSGAQIKEEIKRERCICLYCRKWNLSFDSNFIKTTNDISLDSQISL
jgi:hypothetical protein